MKASGFVAAWVAVQAGVREPHRLLCAYYPSLLVKVRSLALLHQRFGLPDATSEPTRCVFAMLGLAMRASSCTRAISLHTRNI